MAYTFDPSNLTALDAKLNRLVWEAVADADFPSRPEDVHGAQCYHGAGTYRIMLGSDELVAEKDGGTFFIEPMKRETTAEDVIAKVEAWLTKVNGLHPDETFFEPVS